MCTCMVYAYYGEDGEEIKKASWVGSQHRPREDKAVLASLSPLNSTTRHIHFPHLGEPSVCAPIFCANTCLIDVFPYRPAVHKCRAPALFLSLGLRLWWSGTVRPRWLCQGMLDNKSIPWTMNIVACVAATMFKNKIRYSSYKDGVMGLNPILI